MKTLPRRHSIKESPLHKLGNHRRLAMILRVEVPALHRLARQGSNGYSEWDDVNERGKIRHIENPKPRLKKAQARLATLLCMIEPPDFLTCPVKGRSYITNTGHHVGAAEIVTMDVSAYFPSTTWKRVYWYFNKRLLMPSDTAWTLATLATIEGRLPTGSPLSPILAYLAHEDMWVSVAELAREAGCKLTIYMDDVTISGDRVPESLVWAIKQEIHKRGLRLNNKKERRFNRGEGVVTGVVVTPKGLRSPKRAHLKLFEARKAAALPAADAIGEKRRNRVKGMEAQHRQVMKG